MSDIQKGSLKMEEPRNTLTDHYRSRRSHEELGEDIPYEGDDFEEILQEERLEELAAALEKLPQRERDVIILHYYSGISLREISEAIGMSYSNMKIIHRKALAAEPLLPLISMS